MKKTKDSAKGKTKIPPQKGMKNSLQKTAKKAVKGPGKRKTKPPVSSKVKSTADKKIKGSATAKGKNAVKRKTKDPVKKTVVSPVISHGTDQHFIPAHIKEAPATIRDSKKEEQLFHNKEDVAIHEENQKMKSKMARRMGRKRIFRVPGKG